jgi:hypothetical protein
MKAERAVRSIGSRDLARRLGLDASRVRRLAGSGRLPGRKVGHDWLFDVDLVGDEFGMERQRGRPFSQLNALGALFLASGESPDWLDAGARSRLGRRLKSSLVKLRPRLRSRAERRLYRSPESLRRRLRNDPSFILSGASASDHYGLRIVSADLLEGYMDPSDMDRLEYRYGLERVGEVDANLIVHVVPRRLLPRGRFMPRAVAAADLADSADERTKSVGNQALSRLAT